MATFLCRLRFVRDRGAAVFARPSQGVVRDLLQFGVPGLICLVVAFVAFKVGRRWRREYRQAKANRAHLEASVSALTEANSELRAQVTATASGNVVHVGDVVTGSDERQLHSGPGALGSPGLWVPSALSRRSGRRVGVREGLTQGDDERLSLGVGDDGAAQPLGKHAAGRRDVRRVVDPDWDGDDGDSEWLGA